MAVISIAVTAYDSSLSLGYCLKSILDQNLKDYNLIIVNNRLPGGMDESVRNEYKDAVIIENDINLGPAKARNQAISASECEFILFMDSDARLQEGCLINLLNAIREDDSIGAVQPLLLKDDGKTIDSAGIHLSWLRRFYNIDSGSRNIERYDKNVKIFGAGTAAALFRRKALEAVKVNDEYFDQDFFYLAEDVDISWRLNKAGWRIWLVPQARCLHTGGLSRQRNKTARYLCLRNRYLMIAKNETLSGMFRFLAVFAFYDIWRNLYAFLLSPASFLKACGQTIRLFPKILKKRRGKS